MRRFMMLFAVGATTVTLGNASAGSAATAPIHAPYVTPFVSSLPWRSFEETVITLSAEPIKVVVARVPDGEAADADASNPPRPYDTVNPQYPVLFQGAANYGRRAGGGFEHKIVIPPLRPGLYEIFLDSKERNALQRFAVGTLGAIVDFESDDSALLPIDTRTMRRRSDVSLTGYTNTQSQIFRPGSDGLIHLPNDFSGTNLPNWPLGKLILTSTDGSILPLRYLIAMDSGPRTYFDTDRTTYRGGDHVHYEFITRQPASNKEASLSLSGPGANITQQIPINGRITTGTLALPLDVTSGVYRFVFDRGLSALSITDARTSKYEIDVRAATPHAAIGEPIKFVISARTLAGRPVPGLRIPYAWHFRPFIRGPIPLEQALPIDPELMRAETVTDADGNATITIRSPKDRATPVELIAYESGTGVLIATALAETFALVPQASGSTASFAPQIITTQQKSVSVTARGLANGDAILRYGSPPNFHWRVLTFQHNVATFSVSPPFDEDRIPVSIMTATDSEDAPPEQLLVAMAGEPHHLRIAVGCYQRDYEDGQSLHLCARIHDWRNRPARSNVTVTVTEATDADVAAANGSNDVLYSDLYAPPAEMGILYSSINTWKANPPTSYLYPETPRALNAGAFFISSNAHQPQPSGPESTLQPQTLYWFDQVATDKNGVLTLQLPWPVVARPAMYAIRITAFTAHGEVGQAFAFVRYHH